MRPHSRRGFLQEVGSGMLVASVGSSLAWDMGLASARAADKDDSLTFGKLEPLVAMMQDNSADKLMGLLVEKIQGGTDLRTLVAAGALANARSFGGEDYIGYHSFMALAPALQMASELPTDLAPLPVLKVLYRNTAQIQAHGGHEHEVLHAIEPSPIPKDQQGGEWLQAVMRRVDTPAAEKGFAAMVQQSPSDAYQNLQHIVQDEVDVHRVVLSWRSWAMLDVVGAEHASTLLRQSLRFCLHVEKSSIERKRQPSAIRTLLPKLFDQHKLLSRALGTKQAEDAWIDALAKTIYKSSPSQAAEAVAAALAEGFSPDSVGEALSLASNRLVLHDPGRREARPDKPVGSVHGDSIGVHASDSANAWRNIAKVSPQRNTLASLIVGAFHTAGQAGGHNPLPYPLADQLDAVKTTDPDALIRELDAAIRAKDQFRACAVVARYQETKAATRPLFDVLLRFATSEDGALHAEKYYRTVSEEFAASRPAFRWGQLVALARVTASEYGRTSAGYARAKELLKVS